MRRQRRSQKQRRKRRRSLSKEVKAKIGKSQIASWNYYKENNLFRLTGGGHNKGLPAYNRGIPHSKKTIQKIRIGAKRNWQKRKGKIIK
jgi:hypothetical protein